MSGAGRAIEKRLQSLEKHLEQENPVLLNVVRSFKELDHVAYRMGILDPEQSFATRIPWWPLVAVLGTFSAGKSTFINHYLGRNLQQTGNQAVDDKFSVMCFSRENDVHVLPGLALDADPRFPFYKISHEIEKVAAGEGRRIDAYLQLKACPCDELKGKIIIDSPGFDADAQRTSTLRISEHIINLSDLVLVLFDARHPEPGAMQDTLDHLVSDTINRHDSNKFLYILNQIDTAAREDNPEEVIAAWQRALAQKGLTAGKFYTTYNKDAAVPIENEALKKRFESKRDADMAEIYARMHQVEVERDYRIVGSLERMARMFEEEEVPHLRELLGRWKSRALWGDAVAFSLLGSALLGGSIWAGWWDGLDFIAPWMTNIQDKPILAGVAGVVAAGIVMYLHFSLRKQASRHVAREILREMPEGHERESILRAFSRNTRPWRSLFRRNPVGWGRGAKKRIARVLADANTYVQELNDRFTDPSGKKPEVKSAEEQDLAHLENMTEDMNKAPDIGSVPEMKVVAGDPVVENTNADSPPKG